MCPFSQSNLPQTFLDLRPWTTGKLESEPFQSLHFLKCFVIFLRYNFPYGFFSNPFFAVTQMAGSTLIQGQTKWRPRTLQFSIISLRLSSSDNVLTFHSIMGLLMVWKYCPKKWKLHPVFRKIIPIKATLGVINFPAAVFAQWVLCSQEVRKHPKSRQDTLFILWLGSMFLVPWSWYLCGLYTKWGHRMKCRGKKSGGGATKKGGKTKNKTTLGLLYY